MIIKELNLPESEVQALELKPIVMKQLGQFVAITGKNGSGKSRLLNKLLELSNLRYQYQLNIQNTLQERNNYINIISQQPNSPNVTSWQNQLDNFNKII